MLWKLLSLIAGFSAGTVIGLCLVAFFVGVTYAFISDREFHWEYRRFFLNWDPDCWGLGCHVFADCCHFWLWVGPLEIGFITQP